MHPAPSVIIFTILSGLGFGLFIFLGLGLPNVTGWAAFYLFFLAYGFSLLGLLSSTFHLGNPQRFLKAFSQWRTSWLSREGVISVSTLILIAPFAIGKIFFQVDYALLGVLCSGLALLTIICTSMIYGQLKTVPRWNNYFTPILFVLYSLGGGAIIASEIKLASYILIISGFIQIFSWKTGDKSFNKSGSNIKTATGLGQIGDVRLLEGPHSGTNYLLKEMVYIIGRKHSQRLRIIGFLFVGLLPGLILLSIPINIITLMLTLVIHLIGVTVIRWLFFAEAEHVVGLYYSMR
ncbi:dimethyl sulfoxide reductase anchor subunit [Paracoccaceae bacterium]|nr:dimethyl sulfoxide reductase anchor subunit [Paracoccaceae bacterium]MDB4229713.1 dimethyl sulfoxide reductase anchor subunit [Paracoccaceae bacterium]|tara:strand:+ start:5040 stop:5915 length:876 start_codon:yes stop_codon:yes gene_type:complete